jgi:serine protease Do
VNMNGEVVGINTAIATTNARYQGYGFAVPVNLLKTVAADLIRDGKVRRGYIGVQIQSIDATMANALGLERTAGVLVQSVVKGGAGEQAGLKEKDVILSVDGKETNEANELQSHIATRHPGDVVTLKVFRDGKTLEKKVTLKPRDEDSAVRAAKQDEEEKPDSEEMASAVSLDALGLSVRALTPDEKKEAEVTNGVLVVEVKPFSEASERGIMAQDLILEADRKDLKTPKDLKSIVEGRKKGESILMRVKRQGGVSSYVAVQIPRE